MADHGASYTSDYRRYAPDALSQPPLPPGAAGAAIPGQHAPAVLPERARPVTPPRPLPPPRPQGSPNYGGAVRAASMRATVDDFGTYHPSAARSVNSLPTGPRSAGPERTPHSWTVAPDPPPRNRDSMMRKPLPTPPPPPPPRPSEAPARRALPTPPGMQPAAPSLPASTSLRNIAEEPGRTAPTSSAPQLGALPSFTSATPLSAAAPSPSRATSNASSLFPSTSSHMGDSFTTDPRTSMTSHSSLALSHKTAHDANGYGHFRTESPIPESPLPDPGDAVYAGLLDAHEEPRVRTLTGLTDAGLPSTPKAVPPLTLSSQRSFDWEGNHSTSSREATEREFRQSQGIAFPAAPSLADTARPQSDFEDGPIASSSQALVSRHSHDETPSWAADSNRGWVQSKLLLHQTSGYYDEQDLYDEYDASSGEDEAIEEMNESYFFGPQYLSEMSVRMRDKISRGHHVKGGITWVGTFTGKDLVSTIQASLPEWTRDGPMDRRFALITARSVQQQLWVVEVDGDDKPVRDSPDVVFKFMSEMEGMADVPLPKGVLTMATKCYSPSCSKDNNCYAPRCPNKTPAGAFLTSVEEESGPSRAVTKDVSKGETDWTDDIDPLLLAQLTDQQVKRQTLIREAIKVEEKYEADLAALDLVFITPLMMANPPIIQPYPKLDQLIRTLFGNIIEIRRASRSLLDNYSIRLREQSPLIRSVGDIFLEAAIDFRSLYPAYTDNLPNAEALLSETLEEIPAFATWLDRQSRTGDHRWDLRFLLKSPAVHLQHYPKTISSILDVTPGNDPDYDFLHESLESIQNISFISQLKLFQASKGRGPHSNLKWFDIVSPQVKESLPKKEFKRQMHIWELIEGEMQYVADLEAIETIFITPLRQADKAIIDRARLENFIDDAFHNYRSIMEVHQGFLRELQERQVEQHPHFGIVSDLVLDASLNWYQAYMEYLPHYPIAKAKIDEEKLRNPAFAQFLENCVKHPLADRQDIFHFTSRPINRLLRYKLLLQDIYNAQEALGPPDHPDLETIPQVIELNDNLAKATQKGVAVNAAKVELWALKTTLDCGKFGPRVLKELDLLNPMRELIGKGKVYRQPEGTISGAWSELHLLLFDNYFVLVKQTKVSSRNKDAPARFIINRRPVPLELLSLGDFSAPSQNRSLGLLKTIRGGAHEAEGKTEATSDSRTVYPFTYSFIGQGSLSGQYTLWTDSAETRQGWHEKLKHAKVLRNEVNEAGKVFDFTPISTDTFFMAPSYGAHPNAETDYTGRVTCSCPFITADGRKLVAVGCEQGVWIGVRHEPKSLRKVLHVRGVTQVAVLEEFGIFLVLADKSLLAYHLEALVPTAQTPSVRAAPQRLSGVRDIAFFSVGQIGGRTLVIYMKRKGMDSIFRALEPLLNRGQDENRNRGRLGGLLQQRTELFRVHKDFFIPNLATGIHFLRAKVAIVCQKGFEIMDLDTLKGGEIPNWDPHKVRERPQLQELKSRLEGAKPVAMFRSTQSEFLLCYDTFGVYVSRHGEPNRDMLAIDWEGTAESVVFHPPYILLISPSFIEVRHVDTAKLLQIYTGKDIRCTWDGTGGMANRPNDWPDAKGWGDEVTSTEPRLHICKLTDDARRTKGIGQSIFELTPTLLLNNPLLNPVHTHDPNYFPPAPLTHRTSMSTTYSNGNLMTAADRRSISSVSTTTYGNGTSSAQSPYPSSPVVSTGAPMAFPTPTARRVSDQSHTSPGSSGFSSVSGLGGPGGGFTAIADDEPERYDQDHYGSAYPTNSPRTSSTREQSAGYTSSPAYSPSLGMGYPSSSHQSPTASHSAGRPQLQDYQRQQYSQQASLGATPERYQYQQAYQSAYRDDSPTYSRQDQPTPTYPRDWRPEQPAFQQRQPSGGLPHNGAAYRPQGQGQSPYPAQQTHLPPRTSSATYPSQNQYRPPPSQQYYERR